MPPLRRVCFDCFEEEEDVVEDVYRVKRNVACDDSPDWGMLLLVVNEPCLALCYSCGVPIIIGLCSCPMVWSRIVVDVHK